MFVRAFVLPSSLLIVTRGFISLSHSPYTMDDEFGFLSPELQHLTAGKQQPMGQSSNQQYSPHAFSQHTARHTPTPALLLAPQQCHTALAFTRYVVLPILPIAVTALLLRCVWQLPTA